MIECAMTQDILKYKSKFVGNFSAREALWLVLGGSTSLISYFYFLAGVAGNVRIYISGAIAIPFFLIGFLRPFNQPLEKILWQILYDNFICPAIRRKEVHYPEYEKFVKGTLIEEEPKAEDVSLSKIERPKSKKVKSQKNNTREKKITKSKEFKAIR